MSAAVTSAYAQLLSVGVLFIGLHCVGMCGPLLLGLDLGGCVTRRQGVWRHVLAYQAGKLVIYAALGALAGALGGAVASTIKHGAPILTAALGAALLARPWLTRLSSPAGELPAIFPRGQRLASRLRMATLRFAGARTLGNTFLLGVTLSVLPCMVVMWVLTLAVTTGSALHGAGVMVLLVIMNTAPLLGVTLLPRLVRNLGPLQRASRHLMTFSGAWMLVVAAAAANLIPHAALHFTLWDEPYMLMFW